MSDTRAAGPLSAIAVPVADELNAHSRRLPHAQRQSRAGFGAALLCGCYVTAGMFGPFASPPPVFLYAWCGSAALGAFCLLSGFLGRARGPLVGGLGLFAEVAGASWLLWRGMYPAGWPFAAFLLHGLYLAALCSALAQVLAVLVVMLPTDAERVVRRNMAAKNPPIVPVRRAG